MKPKVKQMENFFKKSKEKIGKLARKGAMVATLGAALNVGEGTEAFSQTPEKSLSKKEIVITTKDVIEKDLYGQPTIYKLSTNKELDERKTDDSIFIETKKDEPVHIYLLRAESYPTNATISPLKDHLLPYSTKIPIDSYEAPTTDGVNFRFIDLNLDGKEFPRIKLTPTKSFIFIRDKQLAEDLENLVSNFVSNNPDLFKPGSSYELSNVFANNVDIPDCYHISATGERFYAVLRQILWFLSEKNYQAGKQENK